MEADTTNTSIPTSLINAASSISTTTSTIVTAVESNTVVRLLDSLVSAVVKQSNESDERTRTFLSYWMSPYALMCMITAVIMNRVVIFASSRNHRRLPFYSNIILRILAVHLLFQGSYGLFVSLKATTQNKLLQYVFHSKYFDLDPAKLSTHTFMAMPFGRKDSKITASTYILRNFHVALCLSQIMDTFISVASGCKPSMETGITLFEYSLAFQEAQFDARMSSEMIIIAFIALVNQVNIHLLGMVGWIKYKLITSSMIGLFTLGFYAYNIFTLNIFKLPFTIIIGYFPHFCVLAIIIMSLIIYILSGIARMSFDDLAMSNVWENWNSVNFSLADDFYVALINFGEFVINISVSQSYVQEASEVILPKDNYISTAIQRNKYIGYGNEIHNHPELQKKQNKALNQKKRKLMLWNRIKVLSGIVNLFLKMVRLNFGDSKSHSDKSVNDLNYAPVNKNDKKQKEMIDIDDIDDLDNVYPKLLLELEISERDESKDYVVEEEEEEEYDDIDDYYENENGYEFSEENNDTAIKELITVDEFQHLFVPESSDDLLEHQIMSYHLQHIDHERRLTRSDFARYYTDEMKLLDMLIEKKLFCDPHFKNTTLDKSHHLVNDDLGICVICHENSRQIILWPCKCLAICEKCRVSLFVREFANCVCCRSKVEGYSKVYIP